MRKRRTYDTFTRQRVWQKLMYIRSRYPALTWSSMADQINAVRGHNFDRKYFQRLKAGSIGDDRVNDIVEWIVDRFDPNFAESIAIDEKILASGALHFSGSISSIEWHPVSDKDLIATLNEYGSSFSHRSKCQYSCFVTHIFPNTYFIRCQDHDFLPSQITHYVIFESTIYSATTFVRETSPNIISRSDILSFVFLLFNFTNPDSQMILNQCDLDYLLLRYNILVKLGSRVIFEPPEIRAFNGDVYHVAVDVFSDGNYARSYFKLEAFELTAIDSSTGFNFHKKLKLSDYLITDNNKSHTVMRLEQYQSFFDLCSTGRILYSIYLRFQISCSIINSFQNEVSVDEQKNNIIVCRNKKYNEYVEFLLILGCLRTIDQKLIGFTFEGDPSGDLTGYAARMHSKNLDKIVYICRYVLEIPHGHSLKDHFEGALNIMGMFEIYQGLLNKISKDELFDIYECNQ